MRQLTRRKLITHTSTGLALTSLARPTSAIAQDADKPSVTVASKDFTESIILGEMISLMLEDNGYPVERQMNLGGTVVVHEAMVNGDVDIYVEYTGTALLAILGQELPESAGAADVASPEAGASPAATVGKDPVYDIVAEAYPEQFGLEWLEPWGFNNTYVMAVRGDTAEELGLETISDLEGQSSDLVVGGTQEFLIRPDGLPGLRETYGLEFSDSLGLDPGLVYSALDQGEVDIISATATDGRIPALGFVPLIDDRGFFPPYFGAPVVRQDLLEESPEVAEILNQLAGTIDDATMADLNFQVDDGGMNHIDVARGYLEENGIIGSGD